MDNILPSFSIVGTYMEFQEIQANHISLNNLSYRGQIQIEAEKEKLKKELREHEHKLFIV